METTLFSKYCSCWRYIIYLNENNFLKSGAQQATQGGREIAVDYGGIVLYFQ